MNKNHLTPKIDYLYKPEKRHHARIRLILNSELSNELKQLLVMSGIAVNLSMIGGRL